MGLMSQFGETAEETAARIAKDESVVKETAEKTIAEQAELVRLEDVRKLGKEMQGKLFLTNEEVEKALREQQDKALPTPSKTQTAPEKEADITVTPPVAAAQNITGAITSNELPQNALANAVASGAIAYDPNGTANGSLTPAQKETLRAQATAAMSGDDGNNIAAKKVLAAINSGDDLTLPALAMQLRAAEAAIDQVRTFTTRKGTTVTVTVADDGDGSPERDVKRDYSVAEKTALTREQPKENDRSADVAFAAIVATLLATQSGQSMKDTVVAMDKADGSRLQSPPYTPAQERKPEIDLPSFG